MSWALGPLASFDIESSGVDVESDRIVTATVVRINPGEPPIVRSWLINPGVEIPQLAIDVHGVTNEKAQAEGADPVAAIPEIRDCLADAWMAGLPVIAYNGCFDLTMLDRECRRHYNRTLAHGFVVDPLVLDKAVDRYRKGSRKLVDVCAHYNVRLDGAHTSDGDALAAARVAWRIAQRYPDMVGSQSLADLQQAQTAWYALQQRSLRDYLSKLAEKQDDLDEQAKLRVRARDVNGTWPVKPFRVRAEAAA